MRGKNYNIFLGRSHIRYIHLNLSYIFLNKLLLLNMDAINVDWQIGIQPKMFDFLVWPILLYFV